MVEWHPVVWNSGTISSNAAWALPDSSAGGAEPCITWTVPSRKRFCRLASVWRWVMVAPLGFPVVPEV